MGSRKAEKLPGRPYSSGDPWTIAAASKGGQVWNEERRRRKHLQVDAILDRLAGESFYTFFTQRLGYTDSSWATWRVVARVVDGTPIEDWTPEERHVYGALSGGRHTVPTNLSEVWVLAGRGSGKTTFAAALACWYSTRRYPVVRGNVRLWALAADQEQAVLLQEAVEHTLSEDAELAALKVSTRRERITLAHNVVVEIRAAHWRKVRGPVLAFAACDEVCYWWSDELASNPAERVLRGLKPGLRKGGVKGLLLCISTPDTPAGPAWEAFDRYFGQDHERILVLNGPTTLFNPTKDAREIADAVRDDPLASHEYDATWKTESASFLSLDAIQAVTDAGVLERAPEPGLSYVAFADMSGGVKDSLALAVAHLDPDGETAVLDVVRERKPPLDIAGTIEEWAPLLERFGIASVTGDRYGGQLTTEAWARAAISYEVATMDANEIYRMALSPINQRRCRLLDDQTLRHQLSRLIRQARRGGKDQVTHPAGGHDDVSVVTCGAIVSALGLQAGGRQKLFPAAWFQDDEEAA